MSQQFTISIPAGQAITITADAVAAGYYYQNGNPGSADGGLSQLAAGASAVIGPFSVPYNYTFVSVGAPMTYTSAVVGAYNATTDQANEASTYQPLVAGVSSTEIGYLDGVTSPIQTQLNVKSPSSSGANITYTSTSEDVFLINLNYSAFMGNGGYTANLIEADVNFNNTDALTTLNMGNVGILGVAYNATSFSASCANLTSLQLPNVIYTSLSFILTANSMTTFSAPLFKYANSVALTANALVDCAIPSLTVCSGVALSGTLMATIDLTSLANSYGAISITAGALTSLSLPAVISLSSTLSVTAANMTSFSMGSTLKSIGGNITLTGMALNATSVDNLFILMATLDGTNGTTAYSSHTIDVSGGTSAAPTAASSAARTALAARTVTCTTN